MIGTERWHGTAGGYTNHSCRCGECTAAFTKEQRGFRLRRHAKRVEVGGRLVHPTAPHGTNNAYSNYGCRCIDCTAAHRERRNVRAAA